MHKKFTLPLFVVSLLLTTNIQFTYAATNLSDIGNDKHETAIRWMYTNKIISGYPDGSFKPAGEINRAEFVKIMSLTYQKANPSFNFDSKKDTYNTACFKDVAKNLWYTPYVCYAKQVGIIEGYADGNFKPDQPVSKVEALKIALNSLDISVELSATKNYFTDTDQNAWYAPYIETAYFNNLIEEKSGKYYPANVLLRGDASNLIYLTYLLNAPVKELAADLQAGTELKVIENPNLKIPSDIFPDQIQKFFQLGDNYLALVLKPSMNIVVSLPEMTNPPEFFGGMLIAHKDGTEWKKLFGIEDINYDLSSKNNPYYLWQNDGKLTMSVVDQNGAGSSEGIMKIYTFSSNADINLTGCYYFLPDFSANPSPTEGSYLSNTKELGSFESLSQDQCENKVLFNY